MNHDNSMLTMDDVARLADMGEIGDDLYACLCIADMQSGMQRP